MKNLIILSCIALLAASCGQDSGSSAPAADSQASHWLDGSEQDLKTFINAGERRVVNIGPKRMGNLLTVLYAGNPQGVYATMITEIDDSNAFSEQVIVRLPAESSARENYIGSVKQFFEERGYPAESAQVDSGDSRFLIIDPNPGGGVFSLKSEDDE